MQHQNDYDALNVGPAVSSVVMNEIVTSRLRSCGVRIGDKLECTPHDLGPYILAQLRHRIGVTLSHFFPTCTETWPVAFGGFDGIRK